MIGRLDQSGTIGRTDLGAADRFGAALVERPDLISGMGVGNDAGPFGQTLRTSSGKSDSHQQLAADHGAVGGLNQGGARMGVLAGGQRAAGNQP
jgi:hypothetical protein